VYEERYDAITVETPLRIAEILINKRIFSLARPLWFEHLSISESQLDLRLAGLNRSGPRREALNSLDVVLNNVFFNLLESVILHLNSLTVLSLWIGDDVHDEALILLSSAIASRSTLKNLNLRSNQGTDQLRVMHEHYNDAAPGVTTQVSRELNGITYFIKKRNRQTLLSCVTSRWSPDLPFQVDIDWSSTQSLDLQSDNGNLPYADRLLGGLEAAMQGGKVSSLSFLSL